MSKHVEDVEDRSNTHKGCNAMYVEDVEDIKTSHNRFPWVYLIIVEDVEDRSNTPRGCNAMYVEDVEDRSNLLWLVLISSTPSTLLWSLVFMYLNTPLMYIFDVFDIHSITALRCIWSIFDTFDIALISCIYVSQHPQDQIHLRAVMLCYVCRRCRR